MSPVQNAGPAPANFPASHSAIDNLTRAQLINLLAAYGQATAVCSILLLLLSITVKLTTDTMPSALQGSLRILKTRLLAFIGR